MFLSSRHIRHLAIPAIVAGLAGCGDPSDDEPSASQSAELVKYGPPGAFAYDQGWHVDKHPRWIADVNHDGRADLVGIKDDGVYLSEQLADGTFQAPSKVVSDLGTSNGWTLTDHVRTLADVNGDGRLDVVGLGYYGMTVAFKKATAGYDAPALVLADLGYQQGWRVPADDRLLGDVNADGKADLVGINSWASYAALAGAGNTVGGKSVWTYAFRGNRPGETNQWDKSKEPRTLVDVNHDGLLDLVGLGHASLRWSLSDGQRFTSEQTKAVPGWDAGWRVDKHVRVFARVNGDDWPDLVMMGPGGTRVALGTGQGFADLATWSEDFGDPTGWDSTRHLRFVADVNRDGLDDLVGTKDDGLYVAYSTGSGFLPATRIMEDFGWNQAWRVEKHPRFVLDIDGDGALDIAGFANEGLRWARISPELPPPPAWDHPGCGPEALTAAPLTCAGPWTYTQQARCHGPSSVCAPKCNAYQSCTLWENGSVASPAAPAVTIQSTDITSALRSCFKACKSDQTGEVSCDFEKCFPAVPLVPPTQACSDKATTFAADLRKTQRDKILAETTFDSQAAVDAAIALADSQVTVTPKVSYVKINKPPKPGNLEEWTEQYVCSLEYRQAARKTAVNPACGCSSWGQGTCDYDCGSASLHTTPPASGQPWGDDISDPQCTTCDQLGIDGASQVGAKFDCLRKRYEAGTPDASVVDAVSFRRALATRLRLLYELRADQMTPAQAAYALALYQDEVQATTTCQSSLAVSPGCAAQAQASGVAARLQACKNLDRAGVPVAVVEHEIAHCLGALDLLGNMTTSECKGELALTAAGVLRPLLARLAAGVVHTGDDLVFLRKLDAWYDRAARIRYAEADWVYDTTSGILRAMWSQVHLDALPLPESFDSASDSAAAALLADLGDVGFAVDWRVLTAAFDASRPIDSAPLLMIVADALAATAQRVEHLVPMHDAACRLRGCKPADQPARQSGLVQVNAVLAALLDDARLGPLVGHMPLLAQQQPQLAAALQAVHDRHVALEQAYKQAGEAKLEELLELGAPVAEAADLAALVHAANDRAVRYQATGYFENGALQLLSSAVLKRDSLRDLLLSLAGGMTSAAETFANTRLSTVNDLLAELRSDGAVQSSLDRKALILEKIGKIDAELDGVLERERIERLALVDQQAGFEALATSSVFDPQAAYSTTIVPQFSIRAADTKYKAGGAVFPDVLAVKTVRLQPGETARVQVRGNWGPSCAVRQAQVMTPEGNLGNVSISQPLTGPEGYWAQWSSSGYVANSSGTSSSTTSSLSINNQACLGFDILGSGAKTCISQNLSFTDTLSESHAHGNEHRTSASFTGGIRLATTPFPQAPAGSLVAVLSVADQPQTIVDVRVVSRDDVLAVPQPASPLAPTFAVDVRFVVNDTQPEAGKGPCELPPDALQVDMTILQPFGARAKAFAPAMAAAIGMLEEEADGIIAEGTFLPEEATALRGKSWVLVQSRLTPQGIGTAQLPLELRQYFDSWVDRVLASIARRTLYAARTHERAVLLLDAISLDHERQMEQSLSRLQRLVPRWRLRDLEADGMDASVVALSEALIWHAAPIFELRDPASMSTLRQSIAGKLDQVIDLDFAAPIPVNVSKFSAVATSIASTLGVANFELDNTFRRTIVLAFPRPLAPPPPGQVLFNRANPAASAEAWATALDSDHQARFVVTPADLYSPSGGPSNLACSNWSPVIRRMTLGVLSNNSVNLESFGYAAPGLAGRLMSFLFPTPSGSFTFLPADADGVILDLPMLSNTTEAGILTDFGQSNELGSGAGLSPFTSFEIDVSTLFKILQNGQPDFMNKASVLYLIFEVERRIGSNVALPGICP